MKRSAAVGALLVAMGTMVGLALSEAGIRALELVRARDRLDYGDTIEDGGLRKGFDADVVGVGGLVRWTNNSQGFRSTVEFEPNPAPGTIRVLSAGDSFTAGYRVGNDETFSYKLGVWLNEFASGEVLISAVEEPDNGLRFLREEGLDWNPHVVLFGITLGNDIAQSYIARHPTRIGFRNGLESLELPATSLKQESALGSTMHSVRNLISRFRLVSMFRPRAIGSWYGHPARPRLFDAINGFGVFLRTPPPQVTTAYQRLFEILDDLAELCREAGVELVIAVFPQRYQVQPADWRSAVAFYGLNPDEFDLGLPNALLRETCDSLGVVCADGTAHMREVHAAQGIDLYQPLGDMHWTREGHTVWLEGVKAQLLGVFGRVAAQ